MIRKRRKSRKGLFLVFLILFIFALGISYANENKILYINGSMSAKIDVRLAFIESNTVKTNSSAKVNTHISNSTINFKIDGLKNENEYITQSLTIKNLGTANAKVNTVTIAGLEEYKYIKLDGLNINTFRKLYY